MDRCDCFAYENEHRCNALQTKWCYGCKFYKTQEQYDKEINEAMIFCKAKGIDTYNDFFRYYRKMKILKKRGARNESNNNIQE